MGSTTTSDQKRYYSVGWNNINSLCGPNGGQDCNGYTWTASGVAALLCDGADYWFPSTLKVNGSATVLHDWHDYHSTRDCQPKQGTFTICAGGSISSSTTTLDQWSIDGNKFMENFQPGL